MFVPPLSPARNEIVADGVRLL